MWCWRKVRRAHISQEDRDKFERYGETVVALLVGSELTDQPDEHTSIVVGGFMLKKHIVNADEAAAWLTERADLAERREDRLETVEWAVLIFVAVGVAADIALVLQRIG
jgi:hypothetical protein